MPTLKSTTAASSASDWRKRASQLFSRSDVTRNLPLRDSLRRQGVAADNIANTMESADRARAAEHPLVDQPKGSLGVEPESRGNPQNPSNRPWPRRIFPSIARNVAKPSGTLGWAITIALLAGLMVVVFRLWTKSTY